jgi:hypothetical protein
MRELLMHRIQKDMHPIFAEALNLLDLKDVNLRNEQGQTTAIISPREHAKALFNYLHMAGYLSPELISKAVRYLAAAKPFARPTDEVANDMNKLIRDATNHDSFDSDFFLANFGKENYLNIDDIIDLITFLQQTSFDRQFGVERDRLTMKSWMEEHKADFLENAAKLGIINSLPPSQREYTACGVMGASTPRVKSRLTYFRDLTVECEMVLALSGNRELSKGLDEEAVMEKVALAVDKPVNYIEKPVGVDKRIFLDGVTETMMVNFLIQELCPHKKIGLIDSAIEIGHWRATSAQNATDMAPVIINKILSQEIKNVESGQYHFLVIAEQPYSGRMAKQIQREFNKELQKRDLIGKISIIVEGCGPGLDTEKLSNPTVMASLNSELGALMAERFNDARLILQQRANIRLRDANILMFSKRDQTFKACEQVVTTSISLGK